MAGVTAAAVAAMQGLGSRPSDVIAGIGPAIAADRYQVGPDVHQAVTQTFGPAAAVHPPRPVRPRPLAPRPVGRQPPRPPRGRRPRPPDPHHSLPHRPRQSRRPRSFLQRPRRPPLRPPRPGRAPRPETNGCDTLMTLSGTLSQPLNRGSVFRYGGFSDRRGARGAELLVRGRRAGVHRAGHAAGRPALAHRCRPCGRAAGVPAGRRLVLQDRGAAGHRLRRDRTDRHRTGLPPRVLPPGPGRVRLPQRPGPDPPAPGSTSRSRPGTGAGPGRDRDRRGAPWSRSAAGSTRS